MPNADEEEHMIKRFVRSNLFATCKFFGKPWKNYTDDEKTIPGYVTHQFRIEDRVERQRFWDKHWTDVRSALNQKRDNVAAAVFKRFKGECSMSLLLQPVQQC